MIIDEHHFFERLGTDDERPRDRHFIYRLATGRCRIAMREATEAGDYDGMEQINRSFSWLDCL